MRIVILILSFFLAAQAFGQGRDTKAELKAAANTPAAKAGKALMDCFDNEASKAKAANLSNDQFQTVLRTTCLEEVRAVREALVKAPESVNVPSRDQAIDFAVNAVRARAYQRYTGVADKFK